MQFLKPSIGLVIFLLAILLSIISIIAYVYFDFPFLFLFMFFPPFLLAFNTNQRKTGKQIRGPGNFCSNCGSKIDTSWMYCPYCSQDLKRNHYKSNPTENK